MKVFRVMGTTDEVTDCELCGRRELKGTVIMVALDEAGNLDEPCYYGVSCAAKAAKWTQKEVKARAKAADTEKREAERRRREEESRRFCQARDAYFVEKYGEDCHFTVARRIGRRPYELLKEFEAQYTS